MLLLYKIIAFAGLFFYLPVLLTKKGPQDRAAFIKERLGLSRYEKTDIWIHTVSVGETLASLPFLKKIKKEFPHKKIVLSTTTYTGQKVAREKFPEADRILYMPLDIFFCVKRVVKYLKPAVFATIETELWPALFHELKTSGSRIVILNGRISDNSFKGYRKIRFFTKKILSSVDFLYMQEKVYADRIVSLGAEAHKVGVMGNFKCDMDFNEAAAPEWLSHVSSRIFLAASTHKGEEQIILDAYDSVRRKASDLKLILAPRHPERFNEVAELIRSRNMNYIRRSEMDTPSALSSQLSAETKNRHNGIPDVILLDTIGELSRVFSKATAAFIGGSLVPSGGHNLLEPAYWSKPMLFGPHMENFPIAKEFLLKSAAVEARNAGDIERSLVDLLTNEEKAERMGVNAKELLEKNSGAVKKAVELMRGYLGTV